MRNADLRLRLGLAVALAIAGIGLRVGHCAERTLSDAVAGPADGSDPASEPAPPPPIRFPSAAVQADRRLVVPPVDGAVCLPADVAEPAAPAPLRSRRESNGSPAVARHAFAERLAPRTSLPTTPAPERSAAGTVTFFTRQNLIRLGSVLLALSGLAAGLALLLARRETQRSDDDVAEEDDPGERDEHVPVLAPLPVATVDELLPLLLQGALPVEIEPVPLPRGARIFGEPLAGRRHRIEAAHPPREPHFVPQPAADVQRAAWEQPHWTATRRLDAPSPGVSGSAWARPAESLTGVAR